MAGRGRGRGSVSRWSPAFDGPVIASVPPLKKNTSQSGSKVERVKNMLSCVRVTCIIDVNHFWAQLGSSTDLEHFDNYMFALNHWCDNQLPSSLSDMPSVGQVVCVRHAASRMWRRAEVTRLSQRSVDVFFLDYGEAECVSLDMLCSNVPSDITSWPPQALYCTLDGIQPPEGEDQWNEKAVKRFSELVSFGQNLAASHENGRFLLTLYIVNEGGLKSVGSILVEEGLAQELNHSRSDNVWPQETSQKSPQSKDNQQMKNLNKLEQQLVMSGFSYLLNPCNTMEQKPPISEYSYESTTLSSSYCTYKENKDSPVVTTSGQVSFDPIKERSPQNLLSNRPHLASPGEFMTSHKPQRYGKQQGLVQEENQVRQRPNPGSNDTNGHSHHNPWYNTWSQNDWKIPQNKNTQLFAPNDIFAGDKNNQPLHDVAFQDSKKAASSLQYHLNGPSAFHDPKFKQQPLMGPFEVHGGITLTSSSNSQPVEVKNPIAKPQSSPAVIQLSANNKEKTLKTELSWQKWKFQRNVKRLFDKTDSDAYDIGMEIGELISAGKLSQTFEGVSEVMIVLEMITERVLDRDGFGTVASKICSSLSGQDIHQYTRYMCEVVSAIRDDLVEQFNVSDWEERCERFCSFIGEMVLIAANQDSSDSEFKSAVDILTRQSLETWLVLNQLDNEEKQAGYVLCLTGLLTVIGPLMEEHNIRFGGFDMVSIFDTIRDHVLSDNIPRSIKNSLLDLMLLKAAGWIETTHDTDTTNEDDDAIVNDDEEEEEEVEEEEEDEDDVLADEEDSEQEWNPYGKIYTMLEKLKLEDLYKRFKDNRIRDTLLVANKDEFKKTLQEAGFPPGVILEIQMFLEKEDLTERKKTMKTKSAQQTSKNSRKHSNSNNEQHATDNNIDKQEKPSQDMKWIAPHKTRDIQLARQGNADYENNSRQSLSQDNERLQNLQEERRALAEEKRIQEERRMAEQQANFQEERKMFERRHNAQQEQGITEHEQCLTDSGGFLSYEPVHQSLQMNVRRMPEQQQQQSLQNMRLPSHEDLRVYNPETVESPQDEVLLSPHGSEERGQFQAAEEMLPSLNEHKRPQHEHEENRTLIDAHNLFEPSYLSRPPPLRVEPVTYDYEQEQESPGNDGPMSYSEVLKAKNEEPFPDPPSKPLPVKLTSLTKGNTGDNPSTQNKQAAGKSTTKETSKDGNRRDQVPRPPPGLPPLPPQNWGQTTELRLTVLPNARRKPEDNTSPEDIWHSKQGFDSPPRPSIGRGGASRGRQEHTSGCGVNRGNSEWPSTSEPVAWRRIDLGGRGNEQVTRPFGPGGQKACFTCGSREHMTCNDRSKLFFD